MIFFILNVLPPFALLFLTIRLNSILHDPTRLRMILSKHKKSKKELAMYKRIYSKGFLKGSVAWTGFFLLSLAFDVYKLAVARPPLVVLILAPTITLGLGGLATYFIYSALRK